MGKGRPILTVRVDAATLADIYADVDRKVSLDYLADGESPLSTWLRDAIREKLDKGRRGRKPKTPKEEVRWTTLPDDPQAVYERM